MLDPDDTQPVVLEPEPPPLPLEQQVRCDLEYHAPILATWCGEWARRGVPVGDLAGIVLLRSLHRRPYVMRRAEIDRRHPSLAKALRRLPTRSSRLDVAVVLGDHDFEVHSIGVPVDDVPDTRPTLPILSPEQRATIEERIDAARVDRAQRPLWPQMFRFDIERLYGYVRPHDDVSCLSLYVGYLNDGHERDEYYRARVDAAAFAGEYGKLALVVHPHEGLPSAVTWVDLCRMGASPADWEKPLPLL